MEQDAHIIDTWGVSINDILYASLSSNLSTTGSSLANAITDIQGDMITLDTRITNNSNYFQDEVNALSAEIAGIAPIVYNNNTFTGGTFDYLYATSNVEIFDSVCSNVISSNTMITSVSGTVSIGTVSSTNSTIQYSPLINSTVNNLTANCNVDISLSTCSNIYSYSNTNFINCQINTVNTSNVVLNNNPIDNLNVVSIVADNYTMSSTNSLISTANIASNMYITGDGALYNSTNSNVYIAGDVSQLSGNIVSMSVLSNVNVLNSGMSNVFTSNINFNSGYITDIDITTANITYQPRVASSADRVSFFFDAVAIPPNTTTYQLLGFTFTNDARLIYEYYNASGVKTVASFNLQDLP